MIFKKCLLLVLTTVIGDWLRYTAANSTDGYKITYATATSGGNTRGTAMVDTKLDGAGNYQTRQVSQMIIVHRNFQMVLLKPLPRIICV